MKYIFLLTILTLVTSKIPPEANQLFPEFVANLSYPVETHFITTEDGYINTYYRIQAKNSQIRSGLPVVYVQHGVADSGDNWIVNNESLAPGFILANNGFDVWFGNSRGNRYSHNHVGQKNSSNPNGTYWDFSWQEMSLYDLPAAFEYIYAQTGELINYIGHSQGTTIMFAALARRDPVILQYLKKYLAAGPVAFVNHCNSNLFHIMANADLGKWLYFADAKKILYPTQTQYDYLELICEDFDNIVCKSVLSTVADVNTTVDNVPRMDVFVGHYPAGASVQDMYYWNQMVENTQFSWYNYGEKGNIEHYNQTTPPLYDLGQIDVPVYLFAGYFDRLADPTDVEVLKSQLTGSPEVVLNTYPYGHATFFWGYNTSWIYDAINIMNKLDAFEIAI
jgi:pimeloyl-ACP methyl ester carboxylesterase